MRGLTAYDIAARMHYRGQPLAEAVRGTMQATLAERGGSGGVIALDRDGGLVVGFNTRTIKRGWLTADGDIVFGIRPEPLAAGQRSDEHTSELQSLMRTSYAVFCLKKKNTYYSF